MTTETFAALLATHLQPIRRLVHRRLRTDEAEDVLQQALMRAFTRRHQLRSQEKFKSWLWSIAVNEVRMCVRSSRPCVSIDAFARFDHPDGRPSPYALFEQAERAERVRVGLAQLNERDRKTIHLADVEDVTAREAAARLGVSEPAFKSTHFRARRRLADVLRKAA